MSGGALVVGLGLAPLAAGLVGREVAALLNIASLLAFLVGFILAYAGLVDCRLDGTTPGRGWAWLAIGCSFASLFVWYAKFTSLWPDVATWGLVAIVVIAILHLLVFAVESTAGKYFFLAAVIGGTLFSVMAPWLLQSREASRRLQAQDNLRQLGMELQRNQELRQEK